MRKSDQLAQTVAKMDERNEYFAALESTCETNDRGELLYSLDAIAVLMGYPNHLDSKFQRAVNTAKITITKSGKKISDHFVDGTLFSRPGETCVTVYAGFLIIISGSPETSDLVARAHDYFASKANAAVVEDEKRLRNRFDVLEENKKLATTAKSAGVQNFGFFNAAGYKGLYGGRNIDDVARMKGLKKGSEVLDFAAAEELAAHLFRITQTNAALKRESVNNERVACETHRRVGSEVRQAIRRMGGTMPEQLAPAAKRIDEVVVETSKRLDGKTGAPDV